MSNSIWQLARAVVWAVSQVEAAEAQVRLWSAVGSDPELYHHAIWQASLEKADYLRWERQHRAYSPAQAYAY